MFQEQRSVSQRSRGEREREREREGEKKSSPNIEQFDKYNYSNWHKRESKQSSGARCEAETVASSWQRRAITT